MKKIKTEAEFILDKASRHIAIMRELLAVKDISPFEFEPLNVNVRAVAASAILCSASLNAGRNYEAYLRQEKQRLVKDLKALVQLKQSQERISVYDAYNRMNEVLDNE